MAYSESVASPRESASMNLLDRYIIVAVLKGVSVVIGVLLAVGIFIELIGQLDDIGNGNYGLSTALTYIALRIPRLAFQVLPAAALVGALLSLGNFAVHRELVVMRTSGISRFRLSFSVGLAGIILMVVTGLLGESVAPSLSAYAREFRAQALHDDLNLSDGQSTWLKDGDHILNLRRQPDAASFGGVYLFELGPDRELLQVASADTAEIDSDNRWVLGNYSETIFLDQSVQINSARESIRSYNLSPDVLGLSVVRHDLLDMPGLRRYIQYLNNNELDADRYLIAYWVRVASIISVFFMTILALPFVLGGLRSTGAGARMLVGLMIGLSYYVAAQVFANSGEVFGVDPRVVAGLPIGALILITVGAMTRVR